MLALTGCSAPRNVDPAAAAKAREGRVEVRRLEKHLINNRNPGGFNYERFARALRNAGRPVEADALVDYVKRARQGDPVNRPSSRQEWTQCDDQRMIRGWGSARSRPDDYTSPVGRLTAKFWIGADAKIKKIRVLRAMDPGAAWILVDSIGESKVSQSRVRRRIEKNPEEFPLELCTSWNHDERKNRLPAGGSIRGF